MKLKKLLKDIPVHQVKGSKEVEITGLCANSKLVAPGNLFIAKKGRVDNGACYIAEAVEAGACAVLTDIYDPSLKNVVQIVDSKITSIEPILASHYYQHPCDHLFMVGITGTNGKTTISFIVKHLLDQLDGLCGLIGTIEYIVGQHRYQANRTTPDVISNHKLLREMVNDGCRSAVMEVTSHALDQGRVAEIEYDVAVFSNLTLEHLDYHHTMDSYCETKSLLFTHLLPESKKKPFTKQAVINIDSPWYSKMIAGCRTPLLTYGIDNQADLRASNISLGQTGTKLDLTYQGQTVSCQFPLVGRFNVYNCLAAIGVALTRKFPLEAILKKMRTLPSVKGRLEPVANDLGLKIYVDFAHSDDSLVNVLECLSEFKQKRIITVFGCGGDRDHLKRPKMAEASEAYSDFSIVTSDNPRSEDPLSICSAVAKGFKHPESYMIEVDRRSAIQKAIEMALPEDIILIAGKGHETYQVFAHKTIEFDDCKVAADICSHLKHQQLVKT